MSAKDFLIGVPETAHLWRPGIRCTIFATCVAVLLASCASSYHRYFFFVEFTCWSMFVVFFVEFTCWSLFVVASVGSNNYR